MDRKHQPPSEVVEATRKLVEPLPQPVPCDLETAVEIVELLGYSCTPDWLRALQAAGGFPDFEKFDYGELAMLMAALQYRERYQPGKFDERKTRTRLALERQDLSLASAELLSVLKFDGEALLCMLSRDGGAMTDEVRTAICEVLRARLGMFQTAQEASRD